MSKNTMTFKIEDYTITLHRGEEESKEMEQKRMARYVTCLRNMARKLMAKHFEEYCPELQIDVENIIRKHISKNINF